VVGSAVSNGLTWLQVGEGDAIELVRLQHPASPVFSAEEKLRKSFPKNSIKKRTSSTKKKRLRFKYMLKFSLGDAVFARQGPLYYKAKIIKVKAASADPYQVHFDGWKKRYDMWVSPEALMAVSPETFAAMEEHNTKANVEEEKRKEQKKRAAQQANQLRAMQKKAKLLAEGADFAHLREEKQGQIRIPFTLKKRLMQDWERSQAAAPSKVAAGASVREIMHKFLEEEEARLRTVAKGKTSQYQSCGAELLLCREWTDGLTFYFDAVLEKLLLVRAWFVFKKLYCLLTLPQNFSTNRRE
jgi:hypothetical protein